MATVKEEAAELISNLSDDATWSDLVYSIYVRRSIEEGLADIEAGRTYSTEEVLEFFGLKA
jgi:hypothetical protein